MIANIPFGSDEDVIELLLRKDESTYKVVRRYDLNIESHRIELEDVVNKYKEIGHEYREDIGNVEIIGPHGRFYEYLFLWRLADGGIMAVDIGGE